jgi:hypothetical protein
LTVLLRDHFHPLVLVAHSLLVNMHHIPSLQGV